MDIFYKHHNFSSVEIVVKIDHSNPNSKIPTSITVMNGTFNQCVFIRKITPILDDDDDNVSIQITPSSLKVRISLHPNTIK